ncbi:DMT family transporter [Acaryochloris thomasi]|nr:DMT family transporter [Acaryochloris thomasi]
MPQSQKSTLSGIGFAIATALLFGSGTPLSKLLLDQTDPWMLAGLLFLGGGCGLLPIVLLRHPFQKPDYVQSGEWRWVWSSTLAGGIAPILLMVGLSTASASSVALLLNFEAVFTAILAWTVFRERWQWPVFLGIIPITVGGILLSQSTEAKGAGWSWGSLAVLGTCLAWAIDSNLTFRVSHRDPFQIALIKNGVAGIVNVAIASLIGQQFPDGSTLIQIGGVGFLCYGLTYCCFVLALRCIGSSRTAAFFALAPLVGSAIAVVVLHETVTAGVAIAALIMTGGALLCAWEPQAR